MAAVSRPNVYTTASASGIVISVATKKLPPGKPDSAPSTAIAITNGGAPVMKLMVIACHGFTSRTRPVALRTNMPGAACPGAPVVADVATTLLLTDDELI